VRLVCRGDPGYRGAALLAASALRASADSFEYHSWTLAGRLRLVFRDPLQAHGVIALRQRLQIGAERLRLRGALRRVGVIRRW